MLLPVVFFLLLPRSLSRLAVDARNNYKFNKKSYMSSEGGAQVKHIALVLNAVGKRSNKSWYDEHFECPYRKG